MVSLHSMVLSVMLACPDCNVFNITVLCFDFSIFDYVQPDCLNTPILLTARCACVCVFFPFILDIKFVGRTSRGHTGGRSHRISHPPSFCGACLNFSREKDSAIPFPRRL